MRAASRGSRALQRDEHDVLFAERRGVVRCGDADRPDPTVVEMVDEREALLGDRVQMGAARDDRNLVSRRGETIGEHAADRSCTDDTDPHRRPSGFTKHGRHRRCDA